jgi:hypothetical protein
MWVVLFSHENCFHSLIAIRFAITIIVHTPNSFNDNASMPMERINGSTKKEQPHRDYNAQFNH